MNSTLDTLREGHELECKLAAGQDGGGTLPKDFWPTYSAMANTEGGIIVLGLKEKRDGSFDLHGLKNPDRIEKDLWNQLTNPQKVSVNLLEPNDVRRMEAQGKTLLEIRIPRAPRDKRPVYINGNPLGNTYLRLHEGDRKASDERIKRMLAEAQHDSRDNKILKSFGAEDLHKETVRSYRQVFQNRTPDHPWNALSDEDFFRQLGVIKRDRKSGEEGLTRAGLLMFGTYSAIREEFPNYILDYQERPKPEVVEWSDRVFYDGTWSGNLYDFYRRVIGKLTANLKVPFQLDDALVRKQETHVHEALREALVNTLIHADYSGSVPILVARHPTGFYFRNPGGLRLPPEQIRQGGLSDCRNKTLQQIFLMLGIGETAGSGFSRILRAWHEQSWRAPSLMEYVEPEQTVLRLTMASFLPEDIVERLQASFGEAFNQLDDTARIILATALAEEEVTNRRMQEIVEVHGRDLTFMLKRLVDQGYLKAHGERRGRSYTVCLPSPKEQDSEDKTPSSEHKEPRSEHKEPRSEHKGPRSEHKTTSDNAKPMNLLTKVQGSRRAPRSQVEEAVLAYCSDHWRTLEEIAAAVARSESTVRTHYLAPLLEAGQLQRKYPDKPNHPGQAYRATSSTGGTIKP